MPNDTHADIRTLLTEATSDLPAFAPAPDRTVRRARRRFVRTVSLLTLSAGLVLGAVVHAIEPVTRPLPAKTPHMASGAWIVDIDTGAATHLVGLPRHAFWFSASRDGTALAVAGDTHGRSQIFLLDPNGSNPRQVTHDLYGASQPALSPDGATLAYQGFGSSTNRNIFVMNLTTGTLEQVTHERTDVSHLGWSPDGTRILYSLSIKGARRMPAFVAVSSSLLKVVDVATRRTETVAGDRRTWADFGTWSPDGTEIAYLSGHGWTSESQGGLRPTQIRTVNADGTNPRPVLTLVGRAIGVAWAPRGNAIAYSAPEGDSYSTYVVDADTHETHRVTPGGFPTWLNDHTVIVQL